MNLPNEPEIVDVDRVDNAVTVQFEGETDTTVYPAVLLHAAKDLARIMTDQDVSELEHAENRENQAREGDPDAQ